MSRCFFIINVLIQYLFIMISQHASAIKFNNVKILQIFIICPKLNYTVSGLYYHENILRPKLSIHRYSFLILIVKIAENLVGFLYNFKKHLIFFMSYDKLKIMQTMGL